MPPRADCGSSRDKLGATGNAQQGTLRNGLAKGQYRPTSAAPPLIGPSQNRTFSTAQCRRLRANSGRSQSGKRTVEATPKGPAHAPNLNSQAPWDHHRR